ncbi:DUF637 domain-containing protein [uncultured Psychrobacter sp.]|uniref:endonuclease toxin domain-containing protein n=1 Tax=uncultured Psychrobacter sp. TaxID=259303 RepID=UPI00345AE6B3
MIAIAIAVAAGPAGSGLTASMVATNAAGIALQTQAAITLINNKGDISKTLKDMASSDTVRNMTTAALTAGVGAQLGLGSAATDTFGQKLANGVGTGVTQAVVDATINGMSFEEALKNSLRSSLVDVFAAQTFSSFIKGFDSDYFADNLTHKLVAAGVGCVSASAKKQSCDAGALGAAVGEMLGDYLVENGVILNTKQETDILNAAKLMAGSVALLTNMDVNVAANSADIAVKNNALLSSAKLKGFTGDLDKNCLENQSANGCIVSIQKWKDVSYNEAGFNNITSRQWEEYVLSVYNPVFTACGDNTACNYMVANNMLVHMIQYAGIQEAIPIQANTTKISVNTYLKDRSALAWQGLEDFGWVVEVGAMSKFAPQVASKFQSLLKPIFSSTSIHNSKVGIQWGKGINNQGLPWEKYVQSILPKESIDLNLIKTNFKAFDHWVPSTGKAISDKTLNTAAASYQKPSNITRTLNTYVDKAVNFTQDGKNGFDIDSSMIRSREIQLAVPNSTSSAQMQAIQSSIQYGKSKGVTVVVTKVK